jgi:endonuclease III
MLQEDLATKAFLFINYLNDHTKAFPITLADAMVDRFGINPFIILSACLISLRAKDCVTTPICLKLFERASTPQKMLGISQLELEYILFSVGFYKVKAATLHAVSTVLLAHHAGVVPSDMESLLALPGVGRKTANLVLGLAFDRPAICVDVHVHRISNLLGWVKTKSPEETEFALQKILPKELWIEWNRQLVLVGQNNCLTVQGCGRQCSVKVMGLVSS